MGQPIERPDSSSLTEKELDIIRKNPKKLNFLKSLQTIFSILKKGQNTTSAEKQFLEHVGYKKGDLPPLSKN